MKKEHPKPELVRLYGYQRKYLKRVSKKTKTSKAAVVRYAIDRLIEEDVNHLPKL